MISFRPADVNNAAPIIASASWNITKAAGEAMQTSEDDSVLISGSKACGRLLESP